jgi:hypothetical protein
MFPDEFRYDRPDASATDGVEVEEIHDADTVRLFVREWQWRARVHFGDRTMMRGHSRDGSGMIET